MKLHLNHKGRPLCGVRSWAYIGDKRAFDELVVGACKRCYKILSKRKSNENPIREDSNNDDKPF